MKPFGAVQAKAPGGPLEIFFHVGLGKAASTYLQYAFFPRLTGITYVQRTQFRHAPERIRRAGTGRFLVSREFDQQLIRECQWFRSSLGEERSFQVRPLIVLRRQDSWFASQYRRHIKNGSPLSFREFLDVEKDAGLWKLSDGEFLPKLHFLEQCFGKPPIVFFYEDLRKDPKEWLNRLASALNAGFKPAQARLDAVHTSYSEHQLKIMRLVSRRFFPRPIAHGSTGWLARRSRLLACYSVLYAAKLIPPGWTEPAPLISGEDLEAVRKYYEADWKDCQQYAKGGNQEG